MTRYRTSGFTLIEVMIVVAIVGVLAAVAYPSYLNQVRKSNRSAAQQFMLDAAVREQQLLLDQRGYAPVAANNSNFPNAPTVVCGTPGTAGIRLAVPPGASGKYTFGIACDNTVSPPTFTVTGTPIAGTSQVADGVLVLAQDGSKTRAGVSGW